MTLKNEKEEEKNQLRVICDEGEGCKNLKHRGKEVAEDVPLGLVLNREEEGDGRIQGCKFHLRNPSPHKLLWTAFRAKKENGEKRRTFALGSRRDF